VRAGLPAIVRVDALPGKTFIGTVSRIAPLPDAQSMWMNPDLKVYTTNIDLESPDPALRSGMSCKADIIVEQYRDVVYIPVQCVLRVDGRPTVYVIKDGQVEKRAVEIGLDNNSMIMIASGLSEGETVLLAPPLQAATMAPGERIPGAGDANDTTTQRINEKLKAANETPVMPVRPSRQDGQTPAGGTGEPPASGTGGPGQGQMGGQGFQMPTADQMQRFQNMTPEEREKAREERLKNMTPEQRQRFQQMRQQGGARRQASMVWVLDEAGKVKPYMVRTGLTDNSYTEVTRSELKEGMKVILGLQGAASTATATGQQDQRRGGPGMMMFR
jgi:hypothetical protein